ncbi:hypothetical protein COV93_02865, partial [Candidatus Woesearchaeota archaeon CG11_big_fil_rev_8_21_14_0_20_43_8]
KYFDRNIAEVNLRVSKIFGTLVGLCVENYCGANPGEYFHFGKLFYQMFKSRSVPQLFQLDSVNALSNLCREARGTKQSPLLVGFSYPGSFFGEYADNVVIKSECTSHGMFRKATRCKGYVGRIEHELVKNGSDIEIYSPGIHFVDGKLDYCLEPYSHIFTNKTLGFERKMTLKKLYNNLGKFFSVIRGHFGMPKVMAASAKLVSGEELCNLSAVREYLSDPDLGDSCISSYGISFATENDKIIGTIYPTEMAYEKKMKEFGGAGTVIAGGGAVAAFFLDSVLTGGLLTAASLVFGEETFRRGINHSRGNYMVLSISSGAMEYSVDESDKYKQLKLELENAL